MMCIETRRRQEAKLVHLWSEPVYRGLSVLLLVLSKPWLCRCSFPQAFAERACCSTVITSGFAFRTQLPIDEDTETPY